MRGWFSIRRSTHPIWRPGLLGLRPHSGALRAGGLSLVVAVGVVVSIAPGVSAATSPRVVDPASNLPDTFASPIAAVNAGRANDGVAPISDSGFSSFTPEQETFVVVNLERVARGLPPFEEMTNSLDALAQIGANASEDPPLPVGPPNTSWANGNLWAATSDPLFADFGWMYEDGCATVAQQPFFNVGCSASPPTPWSHRNNILEDFSALGDGCNLLMGVAESQSSPSLAAVTEGYCGAAAPSDSVFTWVEAEATLGLLPPNPPASPNPPAPPNPPAAPGPTCSPPIETLGYRVVGSDGGVFDFGNFPFCGSTGNMQLNQPIVGMASTPDKGGYWLAAADGGVFAFGDANFYGSMGGTALNAPIVAIGTAPFGNGYWLVAADGGVFAFGAARFYGSMGGTALNAPIVGMAVAPLGLGYWLVAADGGVFAFGGANFYGSMGGSYLTKPIVGMAASPFGNGYWLVAADGGVFAFGAARFYGSMGGTALNAPIVGMAVAPIGLGYWLVATDGGVFGFGDGTFYGSMGGSNLNRPIVGVAA
jgi:hypothetical protein